MQDGIYEHMLQLRKKPDNSWKLHDKIYLLSVSLVSLLVPAIFIAIWPNASPVGTRRAIAVIGGALNEIDVIRKLLSPSDKTLKRSYSLRNLLSCCR